MATFVSAFNELPLENLVRQSLETTPDGVRSAIVNPAPDLKDFCALISPTAGNQLEMLSRRSQQLTQQRFGKVLRFFAPLYVSNECINNCKYCGFSRDNPIFRLTLSAEEVRTEARELKLSGFRNILLVAGEHPKFISNGYLAECVRVAAEEVPGVSLEVGPMECDDYQPLVAAGAEGLVVYQESYERQIYQVVHTAGPKRDFDWRLETPERAYEAGFRRIGIGALFGLSDWRYEAIALAAHARYLLNKCWRAQLTISLPRLRPCAGDFEPLTILSDRHLVQLVCAFRILLPDVGLVLSTREPEKLRNGLFPLGITMISAGSHTEPGGYTGAGQQNLHVTEKGRMMPLPETETPGRASATGQFQIADERSPEEVAQYVRKLGYEPVWKDWDPAFSSAN